MKKDASSMTIAVEQVFDAFATFPLSNPSQADKSKLLHGVAVTAVELLVLAIDALVLGSITSSLWISTGERHVLALCRRTYQIVTQMEMLWFDKMTGFDESLQCVDGDEPVGAGGMMASE
jgi:ATP-binding cassette subfamily B (MDR/TAP) protein 1